MCGFTAQERKGAGHRSSSSHYTLTVERASFDTILNVVEGCRARKHRNVACLLTRDLFHPCSFHEPVVNPTSWMSRAYYILDSSRGEKANGAFTQRNFKK